MQQCHWNLLAGQEWRFILGCRMHDILKFSLRWAVGSNRWEAMERHVMVFSGSLRTVRRQGIKDDHGPLTENIKVTKVERVTCLEQNRKRNIWSIHDYLERGRELLWISEQYITIAMEMRNRLVSNHVRVPPAYFTSRFQALFPWISFELNQESRIMCLVYCFRVDSEANNEGIPSLGTFTHRRNMRQVSPFDLLPPFQILKGDSTS